MEVKAPMKNVWEAKKQMKNKKKNLTCGKSRADIIYKGDPRKSLSNPNVKTFIQNPNNDWCLTEYHFGHCTVHNLHK